ncbi:MAG TPA: PepSY domain-containing protein [Candidatus Mediterraneibacter intestinavium]|nr:PepSY domain-containing protein [Candidatus Mediterraneibacter intestinavium]
MMKKYIAAAAVSMMVLGALTGCGNGGNSGSGAGSADIGRDAALEAALNDAGVSEADTTRLKVSEDMDDGRKVYEIGFDVAEKEYDYEIQASDGAILSSDVETNEGYTAAQNSTQSQQNADNAGTGTSDAAVSLEEATRIALDKVPGATEQDIRINLDYDDGRQKYEGDIIYEQMEYDFEIDANTGEVIEWSEERI